MPDQLLSGNTALALLLLAALLAANGLFAASEFALIATRRVRIERLAERGNLPARVVLEALDHPLDYVALSQLGVTMASLAIGWIGEPAVAQLLLPLASGVPFLESPAAAQAVAVGVAFIVITWLHIALGEQVPKGIVLSHPEPAALLVLPASRLLMKPLSPLVFAFTTTSNAFLHLLGMSAPAGRHVVHTKEELRMMVAESRAAGVIPEEESELAERVFRFADRVAREVMVPRTRIVAVPVEATVVDIARTMGEAGFTRLPVFGRDLDDLVGVVTARDTMVELLAGNTQKKAREFMRPAFYVPESKDLASLLTEMRERQTHMAVVLDEFGGTAGIVTIEDLLEEVVGEIVSESGVERRQVQVFTENLLVIDASLGLQDLNEMWNVSLPTEKADTVGGFVYQQLGRVPSPGDSFTYDSLRFTVRTMIGNRIGVVEIRRLVPES